jgi:hypothetical protein
MSRGGDLFERDRSEVTDGVWLGVRLKGEVLPRCDGACLYS